MSKTLEQLREERARLFVSVFLVALGSLTATFGTVAFVYFGASQ